MTQNRRSPLGRHTEAIRQKIDEQPRQQQETAHKAAKLFNTNRTYVNNAVKMKTAATEVFAHEKHHDWISWSGTSRGVLNRTEDGGHRPLVDVTRQRSEHRNGDPGM
jgi:hypothetical protein